MNGVSKTNIFKKNRRKKNSQRNYDAINCALFLFLNAFLRANIAPLINALKILKLTAFFPRNILIFIY